MKNYMKKSAEISHVFFTFSFSFFLFLCFFRYLRLSVVLSVLFALAAACCAAALLAALLGRKRRKSLFSLRAEKEKNALALYLSVVSAKDVAQFFKTAFPARFSALPYALPSVGENLFYAHLPPQAGTEGKSGADCFFSFSAKPFGTEKSETLLRALGNASGFSVPQPDENKKYAARATLYCLAADEEAAALLNRFGVQCVTIDEIFEKTKTNAALPEAVTALASEKKAPRLPILQNRQKNSPRSACFRRGSAFHVIVFALSVLLPRHGADSSRALARRAVACRARTAAAIPRQNRSAG